MTNSSLLSVGSAVGNHLWQTTVFTAAILLLTLLLRKNPARIRCSLWLTASMKFLLPFSLLITLGSLLPKSRQMAPVMVSAIDFAGEPFSGLLPAPAASMPQAPTLRQRLVRDLPTGLACIWLCGVGIVLLIWSVRWHKLSASLRRSRPASVGREVNLLHRLEEATGGLCTPIPVHLSSDLLEPGIIGIFRPVLLWPERLSERLDDEHIEAILAHELMHVRRHDNLTAALHMLVEAVFWFHPLVWWMERRMVEERERACDEAVIQLRGRPETYAEGLLKTCRFCVESPLRCVSGVTGVGLNKRIISIMTMKMIERLSLGRKMLLVAIGIAAVTAPLVIGQVEAVRQRPGVSLEASAGQSSARPPATPNVQAAPEKPSHLTFEVATIKPSQPGVQFGMIKPLPGGDGYTVQNMSVKTMISVIYRVPGRQIVGAPDWLSSEPFDIEAKADRAYGVEDLHEMFRNLLAERFNLKLHQDTKEGPVYELTIAKSGLKMKPDGQGQGVKIPILPGPKGFTGTRVPMNYLCWWLGQNLQNDNRPVIDKTGLTQSYDFTVAFALELPPGAPTGNLPSELLNRPSIFEAVKEELGLQLTPAKGPVEYYVIDHVEKPSPN